MALSMFVIGCTPKPLTPQEKKQAALEKKIALAKANEQRRKDLNITNSSIQNSIKNQF